MTDNLSFDDSENEKEGNALAEHAEQWPSHTGMRQLQRRLRGGEVGALELIDKSILIFLND